MKIFLSWSGDQSHLLAQAFKEWLPSVFQSVKPFLSSRDISAGVQWFPKLKAELEAADFGIVCLTRSNLTAPYIMLESGAIAMRVGEAKLVPVLCDVAEAELGKNPLTAFNYIHLTQDGILKLSDSINTSLGDNKLPGDQLEKTFTKWWSDFEEKIKTIIGAPDKEGPKKKVSLEDNVEEMLSILRSLARVSQTYIPPWLGTFGPEKEAFIEAIVNEALSKVPHHGADRLYNPERYENAPKPGLTGQDLRRGAKPRTDGDDK